AGGHRRGQQCPPREVAVAGQPEGLRLSLGLLETRLRGLPHPPPVGADSCPLRFPEGRRPVSLPDLRRERVSLRGEALLNVSRVLVHPKYVTTNLGSDLALLQLSKAVDNTAYVRPVQLPSASLDVTPEHQCWVTGWGTISMNQSLPPPYCLQQVNVQVVENEVCNQQYHKACGHFFGDSRIIQSDMLCAGSEGRDSCYGDSGGPMVCRVSGSWSLVGIVSWGYGCALRNVPGVYTRVATYVPWITEQIGSIQDSLTAGGCSRKMLGK
uniref:Peptidase S1 domain-containing protein n=1 Tax=Rhinolophus ferrumequinum TaxID=59479 RepID=A0A671FY70_RHIFE